MGSRQFSWLGPVFIVLCFLYGCSTAPAPPQESLRQQAIVPVTITITKLIELVDPDDGKPLSVAGDYYARVQIAGQGFQNSPEVSIDPGFGEGVIYTEPVTFEPFWTFTRDVDNSGGAISITISLFDADDPGFPLFDDDDEIDINASPSSKAITLNLNLATGEWSGDVPTNQTFSQGDGGDRSKIFFDITTLSADGDADGDGLLDGWEEDGLDVDGDGAVDVDLPALGANPLHKDLFLELDWVGTSVPTRAGIQAMKTAFANAPISAGTNASALTGGKDAKPNPDGLPGINLWVDTGNLMEGGLLVGDNLGGGNQLMGPIGCLDGNFYARKNNTTNFDPDRRWVFRYGISGNSDDSDPCGGGRGEIGGNDFIEYNHDGGTVMHEFGHTLNLRHGGNLDANCKPNFVSVMNYDNQFGINQVGGGTILDFSPPRFAGGRGIAVLPTLSENSLNESIVLDATDSSNRFVFTNPNGRKVQTALNQAVDWNSDGDTADSGLTVNIDTADDNDTADTSDDSPSRCANNTSNSTLGGHDDWSRISLPFRQFGDSADGAINAVNDPEPTLSELQQLEEALNTTDLAIVKSDTPDPAAAGAELTYTLEVSNLGPNPARAAALDDTLPAGVSYLSSTDPCTFATGVVHCELGELLAGSSKTVNIVVKVDPALVYTHGGPLSIGNTATVSHDGEDLNLDNNDAAASTQVVAVADLEVVSFVPVDAPPQIIVGQPLTLTLRKTITNNGPSGPMDVRLTKVATFPSDSVVTPATSETLALAVGLAEARVVDEVFTVQCNGYSHHDFTFHNEISPAEPEDTDPLLSNNEADIALDIECVVPVAIDVAPSQIVLKGNGSVPVAVLANQAGQFGLPLAFDPSTIDVNSVRFGRRDAVWVSNVGASEVHGQLHGGSSKQKILHFQSNQTGLVSGDTEACIKGIWYNAAGAPHSFFGCESVQVK